MPPIEWPTRTIGPVGAAAAMTAARSLPSWSIVAFSFGPRPLRPWLRWSQRTRRPSARRSRRW